MSALLARLPMLNRQNAAAFALPVLVLMILSTMLLPLPAWALDIFFTFNIAFAMLVLLVGLYTVRPLDFAVFPTVLLITAVLRLSLNVASTRVILLRGHEGPDAAGKVIESFAHFLVGGNFAVGFVVFLILMVINFVVITKGAGRIAEVGARFTLDAMPGKQMAIDADLNAGLINEQEAKRRRAEVTQEAEFFGAMDGASKYVRGDAIAGMLILAITIVGGLAVGVAQHDLSFAVAAKQYVLLAIGDGLVAQVPALFISIAAGFVVARVGTGEDITLQARKQLFSMPRAFAMTAGVIALLGLIPGMPHVPFLLFAVLVGGIGWVVWKETLKAAQKPAPAPAMPKENEEATWDDLAPVDALGLEVGYRLVPLVDKAQDGELLKRLKAIRKKFAQEVGFLPPAVHVRDNLELKPGGYRITLKSVVVGEGEIHAGQLLAINPGNTASSLAGTPTKDPAFGLPALWIDHGARTDAQLKGWTVVDASTVVATHFNHVVQAHAAQLFGRAEAQALLDHLNKLAPKLAEDVIPKAVPLPTFQKVIQTLLDEGVVVRDLRTIVDALAEFAGRTQDSIELAGVVRIALGRSICQQVFGQTDPYGVIVIEPELERVLEKARAGVDSLAIEPQLAEGLTRDLAEIARNEESAGRPAVLLVPDRIRFALARLLRRAVPALRVLGHTEIPESKTIRVVSIVGGRP